MIDQFVSMVCTAFGTSEILEEANHMFCNIDNTRNF